MLRGMPLRPPPPPAFPPPPFGHVGRMKISGVPFFIITAGDGATGKAHALSGAQPVARLVAAFDRALLEEEEAAVAEGAGAAEAAEAAGGAAPSCT